VSLPNTPSPHTAGTASRIKAGCPSVESTVTFPFTRCPRWLSARRQSLWDGIAPVQCRYSKTASHHPCHSAFTRATPTRVPVPVAVGLSTPTMRRRRRSPLAQLPHLPKQGAWTLLSEAKGTEVISRTRPRKRSEPHQHSVSPYCRYSLAHQGGLFIH